MKSAIDEKMPDVIWAEPLWIPRDVLYDEFTTGGRWFYEKFIDTRSKKYLCSTPLLEHAREMRKVLEDIRTKQADPSIFRLPANCEEMLAMNYLLATIGEEEEERETK